MRPEYTHINTYKWVPAAEYSVLVQSFSESSVGVCWMATAHFPSSEQQVTVMDRTVLVGWHKFTNCDLKFTLIVVEDGLKNINGCVSSFGHVHEKVIRCFFLIIVIAK